MATVHHENETFADFCIRHGENITVGGLRYFRDGAKTDGHLVFEPPADLHARANNIKFFYKAKLERAEKQFQSIKADALDQCGLAIKYANLPAPDVSPQLQKLKETVAECRKELEALGTDPQQALVQDHRESIVRAEAERRAIVSETHQKISSISLDGD